MDTTKNLKKFGIDKPSTQPTPEQKKAGWERRRQAQRMMDKITDYLTLKYKDLKDLQLKVKEGKTDDMLVEDVIMLNYVMNVHNGKYMIDWMDRNISKAPQEVDQKISGNVGIVTPIDDPEYLEFMKEKARKEAERLRKQRNT